MASSENYELRSISNLRISLLEKREVGVTEALDRIIHSFNFTRKNYPKTKDFVSFVDYVLARSLSSKIKRLEIDCSYLHPYKSHVSRWLSIAVEKNVEDFVYRSSSNSNDCTLPESFYYCSSLVTLHLTFYCFDYGAVIKWMSLKNIKLECVVLSDDDIVKLLFGCPALETMEVDMVGGFSRLEISSLKMKRLNLKGLLYFLFFFETDCPPYAGWYDSPSTSASCQNPNFFPTLKGLCNLSWHSPGETFKNTASLRWSNLFLLMLLSPFLTSYIGITAAGHVHVATRRSTDSRNEMQISNARGVDLDKLNLFGVVGLLRALLYVETLNIDFTTAHVHFILIVFCLQFMGNRCQSELRYLAKGESIDLQNRISSFEFPNLKNVKIVIPFRTYLNDHTKWGLDKLYKLSEFLLTNAKVLKKFVIISKRTKSESSCGSKYLFQLADKLICFPRSSTNSIIMFIQE
ncbi:hypothetical protein H5410_056117 [Solanum commersonii]|uniref:F-box/LRR-repeat protein 15/At3g58940/PEG3-like LRR domain-containing protein n=1 Tax=Solanum commersonii TaxID=4109 RepID=A0A9J5WL66_SOLCO|nr:hypothetical protein H5410_056117 [Solanum commersonii]